MSDSGWLTVVILGAFMAVTLGEIAVKRAIERTREATERDWQKRLDAVQAELQALRAADLERRRAAAAQKRADALDEAQKSLGDAKWTTL